MRFEFILSLPGYQVLFLSKYLNKLESTYLVGTYIVLFVLLLNTIVCSIIVLLE